MDIKSLRPASEYAIQYGVKAIVYGPPGSGKTPIANTSPRPVMLVTEPGMLSMRSSNIPTWAAFDCDKVDEFFQWFFHSAETKNFDTLIIDSISHMAELYLQSALTGKSKSGQKAHGLVAYGMMAANTMNQLRPLFFVPQKHTYLIAKQEIISENGISIKRPYFPGRQLSIEVPHMYDVIAQLDIHNVPQYGQQKAFRCIGSIDTVARNRTGMLNEFEEPDFGKLVKKAMS